MPLFGRKPHSPRYAPVGWPPQRLHTTRAVDIENSALPSPCLSLRQWLLHVPQAASAQRLIYRLIFEAFASAAAARASIDLQGPTRWTATDVLHTSAFDRDSTAVLLQSRCTITWASFDGPQGDKYLPINRSTKVLLWLHDSTSPTHHATILTTTRRTKTRKPGYTHDANFPLLHIISSKTRPRPSTRARLASVSRKQHMHLKLAGQPLIRRLPCSLPASHTYLRFPSSSISWRIVPITEPRCELPSRHVMNDSIGSSDR